MFGCSLNEPGIGDDGAIAIADALKANTTLTSLAYCNTADFYEYPD